MRSSTFVLASCLVASTALAAGPGASRPPLQTVKPTGPLATDTLGHAIGAVTQIRISASFERLVDPDMSVTDPAEVRAMLDAIGLDQRPTAVRETDCPDSVLLHFLNTRLASVRVCIDRPLGAGTVLGAARVEIAIASPGVVQMHRGGVAIKDPKRLRQLLLARQRAFDKIVYGKKTAACPLGTEFSSPPRLYRRCARDSDCVMIVDGCCGYAGSSFVLNEKFAGCVAQAQRTCNPEDVMCPPVGAVRGAPTCERGFCAAGPISESGPMVPR